MPNVYNPVSEAELCLKTVVKNISGGTRIFCYLPPHGVTLADDQEYVVDGNLFDILGGGKPYQTKRKLDSLLRDLQDGTLVVLHTPTAHHYDSAAASTRVLKIHGGNVIVDDPCWGRYISSSGPDESTV